MKTKISRRSFISQTIFSGAALSALSFPSQLLAQGQPKDFSRWALFSDTHISANIVDSYRGFVPYDNMKKVVKGVLESRADGVVITGDLARLQGLKEDYALVDSFLHEFPKEMPVYIALGNHDQRSVFFETFPNLPGEKFLNKNKHVTVVKNGLIQMILLDSLFVTNTTPGFLGKEQRVWLQNYLTANTDLPTFLFLHHPLGDEDAQLLDTEYLLKLIAPFSQVKAVIFGHSHMYQFFEKNGVHFINLPSTAYNFKDTEPLGWVEAVFRKDQGEITLHAIAGNMEQDKVTKTLKWKS